MPYIGISSQKRLCAVVRVLLRDTLLRTLLREDVAAPDAGVRMLLRDTELRTPLCEDVAARYAAADAAV